MYDFDRIRADNDLISIAEQAGATFRQISGEHRSICPLHHGDNPTAFSVYVDGGVQKYKCFTRDECGTGDVIDFVSKWLNYSTNQACEWLGGDKQISQAEHDKIIADRAVREIKRLEEATNKALSVLEELRKTETWRKYHETVELNESYQQLWESEGIPVDWQNYWWLGYCNNFSVMTTAGKWNTPTMTIPIFTGKNWDLQNIKHRLLNPYDPKDKYRPEKSGLSTSPYFCEPEIMYDSERILVVEGEKKAMVTYLTLEDPSIQVIGLPGKNQWRSIIENLSGQTVYIMLDPDALKEAVEFSGKVNGRVINIAMKIDDAINEGAINKYGIQKLLAGARRNYG
jgi:hypothetical protein